MKETFKRWLTFAEEDLKMSKLAVKEGIYNQACFHSQQCVEKILKGYIEYKGELPPKTHKLVDLFYAIHEDNPFDKIKQEILLLDRFYIPTRYPDAIPGSLPDGLPGKDEADEAVGTAEKVFKIALELIKG